MALDDGGGGHRAARAHGDQRRAEIPVGGGDGLLGRAALRVEREAAGLVRQSRAQPRICAACTLDSVPPRRPIGVRTASTMTAAPTTAPPSAATFRMLERVSNVSPLVVHENSRRWLSQTRTRYI